MVIPGNIFAVFDHLKSKGWTVPWGISRSFEAMQLYDDRYCFVPMPMNPLYRGQSNYYEPSKASLYRRKWSTIEEIERELQIEELKIELEKGGCRFLDIIPYRYTDKEKELLKNEYIQKYPGAHIK